MLTHAELDLFDSYFSTKTNGHILHGGTKSWAANWISSLMHFDPLILHWPGSESLLANKFYLINTEEGSAGLTLTVAITFILALTRCSWWHCCVLHPGVVLHLAFLDLFFLLHPVRGTCLLELVATDDTLDSSWLMTAWGFWLSHRSSLFLSLAFQSCYFDACLNSTQLFSNLPKKWWTKTLAFQRRCKAASPAAGTHALGMYTLVCWEFLWLWLQWGEHDTCICRCSGNSGKQISLVSVSGKYCLFLSFKAHDM